MLPQKKSINCISHYVMATHVYKEDVLKLFNQAISFFESESGLSRSNNRNEFFNKMAEAINLKSNSGKVTQRFLQKQIGSAIRRKQSEVVHIETPFLNAMYAYVYQDPNGLYESGYLVGTKKYNIENAGVQQVSKLIRTNVRSDQFLIDFPIGNPNWPATPTIPFKYANFKRLWIKDESFNETGTFKDRWAWEIIKYYRTIIENARDGDLPLPRLYMISTGPAVLALQYLLKKFKLPEVKAVVQNRLLEIDTSTKNYLQDALQRLKTKHGDKEIKFVRNISEYSKDIKHELDCDDQDINLNEIKDEKLKQILENCYQQLALEILDQNPDYCFVPYGSGLLFENILRSAKKVIEERNTFSFLNPDKIKNCIFYGAQPNRKRKFSNSLLDKLYTKRKWISDFELDNYKNKYCNSKSSVIEVDDTYVRKALKVTDLSTENKTSKYERVMEHALVAEPSGLAGFALFLQLEDTIPMDAKIIILNTGYMNPKKIVQAEIAENLSKTFR